MDQYLINRQKEILLRLLGNPADTGSAYLSNLQELVTLYPQSGLFRALYGRALNEPTPMVAGAYFDSRALYKLLHHYENIPSMPSEQVVIQPDGKLFVDAVSEPAPVQGFASEIQLKEVEQQIDPTWPNQPSAVPEAFKGEDAPANDSVSPVETPEPDLTFSNDYAEPPAIPAEETLPEYHHFEDYPATEEDLTPFAPAPWEVDQNEYTSNDTVPEPATTREEIEEPLGRAPWELDDDEEEDEVTSPAPVTEQEPLATTDSAWAVTAPADEQQSLISEEAITWDFMEPQPENQVDDELATKLAYWASLEDEYDAPDAQLPPVEQQYFEPGLVNKQVYNDVNSFDAIGLEQINAGTAEAEQQQVQQAEADRMFMGSIAATDYFKFDKAFGESAPKNASEQTQNPAPEQALPATTSAGTAAADTPRPEISRYHDEKMPYTFMWWLDKTRRDHGSLYQPYVQAPMYRPTPEPASKPRPDELQQQYFENIFHLSSAEDFVPDAAKTIEFDMQSKEDRIIQRFITQDPHIHPPVGDKLDTENKAKKSSEDGYDMVTETLARIYADQMLFPKAIATYKKLMLKFPEKSRYFASRIENLEKRTN